MIKYSFLQRPLLLDIVEEGVIANRRLIKYGIVAPLGSVSELNMIT